MSNRKNQFQAIDLHAYIMTRQADWQDRGLDYVEAAAECQEALGFSVTAQSLGNMCRGRADITFTSSARKGHGSNAQIARLTERVDSLQRSLETLLDTVNLQSRRSDALYEAAKSGRVTAISEAYTRANEQ